VEGSGVHFSLVFLAFSLARDGGRDGLPAGEEVQGPRDAVYRVLPEIGLYHVVPAGEPSLGLVRDAVEG